MVYFLIGAPYKGQAEKVWNDINKNVISSGLSAQAKGKQIIVDMARFKMGNLDSLMFINDNLIKQDQTIESLLKKIERQYLDITEKVSYDFVIESREGTFNVDQYLMQFKWDDSRFPRNTPLVELSKALQNRASVVDSDLRTKIQNYQEVKNQSQQIQKKEGNLLVRDLVDVLKEPHVKQKDFVYSEYLTTLVAIVSKTQVKEFLECYEFLHENVVPKSAKQFQIDDKDNLTVWRVVLVKQNMEKQQVDIPQNEQEEKKKTNLSPVDEFIIKARDKLKITVKEFEFKPNESRDRERQRHELRSKSDNLNTVLKQACEKAFSDLYVTYIHLKQLRLVVDIAMRFGTSDPNLTCIIKPELGKEKKVQQSLLKLFADPSQIGLYGTKEELEDTEDFFPFVYIAINIP